MNTVSRSADSRLGLKRDLTLLDAIMVNVGVIIGSGIFFVPSTIAGHVNAVIPYLAVWVVGGILSLFGALAIAELGAARPAAGGQFVYLTEAYGPLWGFLYGWTSFTVINSAAIAAIAVAFAAYLGHFTAMPVWVAKLVAIATIALLTAMNALGVKIGAWIQNGFAFAKVAAILALIVAVFAVSDPPSLGPWLPESPGPGFAGALGLAMIAVLWSYDGWVEITYAAGEVKRPERNLPRALLWSMVIVVVIYLLLNIAYLYALPMAQLQQSERVAAEAAGVVFGPLGASLIAVAVLLSTFGATNGFILGAARIYYAMALRRLFFKPFARVHPTWKTPAVSLAGQALWSSFLVLTGSFEQLFTYVVFAGWLFYGLTAGAVLVMRRKHPNMKRPYRTWGYPLTPILFMVFAGWLVVNTIVEAPLNAAIGFGMILSGAPVYFFWRRNQSNGRDALEEVDENSPEL